MFSRQITTSAGLALDTKIRAGLVNAEFTKVSLGNGSYTESEDLEDVTGLKQIRQSFGISSITIVEDNIVMLRVVVDNAGLTEGYYISEVGIYARDPDEGEILYSIALGIEGKMDYQPSETELVNATSTFDHYVAVSNAENAIIKVGTGAAASAEDLTNLKNDLRPTNTASGTGSVTMPDAADAEVKKLVIKGRSEQETTKGINLLNMYKAVGGTANGITAVINPDGTYTSDGTKNNAGAINIWFKGSYNQSPEEKEIFLTLEPGQIYYLKDIALWTVENGEIKGLSSTDGREGTPGKHTISEDAFPNGFRVTGIRHLDVSGDTGTNITNQTYYPMVSKENAPWELYTDGNPAPNPDYPHEIRSVENPIIVSSIGNRNLLTETNNGIKNWVISSQEGKGGIFSLEPQVQNNIEAIKAICANSSTGWHFLIYKPPISDLKKLKPNTKYTLSFNVIGSTEINNLRVNIQTMSGTNSLLTRQPNWQLKGDGKTQKVELAITTNDLSVGVKEQVVYFADINAIGEYIIWDLKLEEGDASPWSPAPEEITIEDAELYRQYLSKVDLTGYTLYGIGDVRDRIECRGGEWGITGHYLYDNIFFAGYNFTALSNSGCYTLFWGRKLLRSAGNVLCNLLQGRLGDNNFNKNDLLNSIGISGDRINIYTPDLTLEEVNTILKPKLEIIAEAVDPTWEPFPDDIQQQFNGLRTYPGEHSTIYVVSDVAPDIETEYYRNTPVVTALIPAIDKKVAIYGGDISNTIIKQIVESTEEFPIPAAGENTAVFTGKITKFLQDYVKANGYIDSLMVPLAGWTTGAAPYTQTITLPGVRESDRPDVDIALNIDTTPEDKEAMENAYSCLDILKVSSGSITLYALSEKPEATFYIKLKGVSING